MNKKRLYQSPSLKVTPFIAESNILQYSGVNDMSEEPGMGWTENLDNDLIFLP